MEITNLMLVFVDGVSTHVIVGGFSFFLEIANLMLVFVGDFICFWLEIANRYIYTLLLVVLVFFSDWKLRI